MTDYDSYQGDAQNLGILSFSIKNYQEIKDKGNTFLLLGLSLVVSSILMLIPSFIFIICVLRSRKKQERNNYGIDPSIGEVVEVDLDD